MAAVALMAALPSALAWTAVAQDKIAGISFVYYMAKSAEEAEKQALAGCHRAADQCELLGDTVDGPVATAVVRGKSRHVRASNIDPLNAERQALQACRQHDTDCRLVSAAWDRGTHIMAIVTDHENAWVGPSAASETQAREETLADCRKFSRSPERCTLFHVLNGPGWIAIARSDRTTGVGLSVRSPDIARNNALAECAVDPAHGANSVGKSAKADMSSGAGHCKDVQMFHNPSGTPEPASYREMVTRIRADRRAMTASVPPFLGRPEH